MKNKKMTLKEELTLFKQVNGVNKIIQDGHTNFIQSSVDKEVTRNQGISRGKLRNFIESVGESNDLWKNV